MKAFLYKMIAGCVFVSLATTALQADPPTELSPATNPPAVTAGDTRTTAPAAAPQPDPPQPLGATPAFQPVHTDSGSDGIVFRPPKRASQVQPPPPAPAELVITPDLESDEPAEAPAGPAVESLLPADLVEGDPEVAPHTLPPEVVDTEIAPKPANEPKVGTMSFNGVEPGRTTLAEMKKQWGEPVGGSNANGLTLYTFSLDPFKQIDVTVEDDLVTSVVVYLDPPMLPAVVANELRLRKFVPVPIPDADGRLLGQVYPERGVLFGFVAEAEADVPRVSQIVVEPISAEPFVLRALYDFNHRYSSDLEDLDYALGQDANDAQAHWVKSRLLAEIGRYDEAVTEARTAAGLDASIPTYRLQLAYNLGLQGQFDEATKLVEAVRTQPDTPACVKARAECELGRILTHRPDPDYKAAITHYQAAIELASPFVGVPKFEIRRAAKQILIDANSGIGRSVALGNYQRKSEVAGKWLDRAGAYADQYVGGDNGPKHLPLVVFANRMGAYTGMKSQVDPSQAADAAIQAGRQLIAWSDDPLFEQQVEWLLGAVLMDAVRVEHGRGEHLQALRYAEMAVPMLESALAQRQLAPAERFAVGRFYFLAGAVEAVKKQDHVEAAGWYVKALPYLASPDTKPASGPATGRMGEWMVSMGVSFWEVGQQDRAVELTQRGADLIQLAVNQGIMKKTAMGVPYSNLATMHEALGNEDKASSFGRLANAAEPSATEIKRR